MNRYELVKEVPRGMGSTYGNFIRRVAMIKDVGWALAAVRIDSGKTKTLFEIPEGSAEDVCEIVSNLQQVKITEDELNTDLDSNNYKYISLTINNTLDKGSIRRNVLSLDYLKEAVGNGFSLKSEKNQLVHVIEGKSLALELIYLKSDGSRNKQENAAKIKEISEQDKSDNLSKLDGYIYLNTLHKSIDNIFFTVKDLGDGKEKLTVSLASEVKDIDKLIKKTLEDETEKMISIFSEIQ